MNKTEYFEKMKYITILDFEMGKVYQYEFRRWQYNAIEDKFIDSDYEEYLNGLGHNLSNCEWMIHKNPEIITL